MTRPPSSDNFGALAHRAADRLRALALDVQGISPQVVDTIRFSLDQLTDPSELKTLLGRVGKFAEQGVPSIYVFSLSDVSIYPILNDAFKQKPEFGEDDASKLAYSRLNKHTPPESLYVGSSCFLVSRISQHFGCTGGSKTYAMRLNRWALGIAADVELSLWRFADSLNPIELEVVEQQLWEEQKPMLGKRSGH